MAGTLKTNRQQLGDSATATQNFTLTAEGADGSMKIARGNAGATTQDILTVDSSGNVQLTRTTSQSMVRLNTSNGFGSTNTVIRRFTNVVTNQGSDITYADSATLGATFTINTNGVYSISYGESFSAASDFGLSINSTQLTTIIYNINVADRPIQATTPAASQAAAVPWTGFLSTGAVVRPHTSGTSVGTADRCQFTIVRVS